MNRVSNQRDLIRNYYALLLSILENYSAKEALNEMGIKTSEHQSNKGG